MQDFERQQSRWTAEELEASAIAGTLYRKNRAGDEKVHLGRPQFIERELTQQWMADGYGRPMTFVDEDCKPIIVARLDEELMENGLVQEERDVRYKFFADNDTHDVIVPYELAGHVGQQMHTSDYPFYDTTNEAAVRAALGRATDENNIGESMAWLVERFGGRLVAKFSEISPYLANEEGVLAVRLDAIPPNFDDDSSYSPARF